MEQNSSSGTTGRGITSISVKKAKEFSCFHTLVKACKFITGQQCTFEMQLRPTNGAFLPAEKRGCLKQKENNH